MRRLLNTLFVTSEDVYLSLDGENVVVKREPAGGWPFSTPQSGWDRMFFLCRCFSGTDGSLCQEKRGIEFLHA